MHERVNPVYAPETQESKCLAFFTLNICVDWEKLFFRYNFYFIFGEMSFAVDSFFLISKAVKLVPCRGQTCIAGAYEDISSVSKFVMWY